MPRLRAGQSWNVQEVSGGQSRGICIRRLRVSKLINVLLSELGENKTQLLFIATNLCFYWLIIVYCIFEARAFIGDGRNANRAFSTPKAIMPASPAPATNPPIHSMS